VLVDSENKVAKKDYAALLPPITGPHTNNMNSLIYELEKEGPKQSKEDS
jgi:hypothetical protein